MRTRKNTTAPLERLSIGVNEAAELLGIGRSSIFRLVQEGQLKGVKLGKRRLFLVSELEALLASLQKAG